ncbi:Crp/Fnr family transcriptional regulator [Marinicrinis sediminis]|uniref:Crp/Fnr family transcriptional regulator n=1 Tax=Marinicrinis sediminis TaxID=1652465 RepID=A0ABW5RDW8_9BACL
MNKLSYLSKISLFEALTMDELKEIEQLTPMSTIQRGQLIQSPDSFREGLYMLKEGKLKLYKLHPDGKQFIVSVLGSGNVFGEIDSFSLGTRDTFIETMDETILCSIGKEQFEQFLIDRPHLTVRIMKELSRLLKERDAMLAQLALGNVRERILHLLQTLAEKFGVRDEGYSKIDMPLTHQEIASMIGSTRETVTMVLNELCRNDQIKTGRMSVYVRMSQQQE